MADSLIQKIGGMKGGLVKSVNNQTGRDTAEEQLVTVEEMPSIAQNLKKVIVSIKESLS